MDVEQFKEDVRGGRIDADRLVELVVTLSRKLERAEQRIEELERKLGDPPTEKIGEPFSIAAEEKRQEARGKKQRKRNRPQRCGRIRSADKIAQAQRTEQVFPAEVPKKECYLSHTRVVWRLENGQAVLVAYEVYRGPNHQYGQIPAVLGRSEFGIEIVLAIAYQVFVIGLSFDKVCLLMNFFQNLRLRKSQVDALLNQLSRHWEREFDLLCTLLANSLVVHADETSWSIRSVWAFLSEKVRLLFFGVHKDALTLEEILDPATFEGIVISDDASVYANFSTAQKCWAHLLRKAIKLSLVDPTNEEFRHFTDRLLEIYRTACRVQQDQRFSLAGREQKVGDLDDEILELCGSVWAAELPPGEGPEDDYRLLVNELMKLMLSRQLFTFVTAVAVKMPNGTEMPVAGTNNEAERTLRPTAEARNTGRTSKTLRGARRRTVLVSVLESLRVHLATFTLSSVIEEVRRWCDAGLSCFAKLLKKLKLPFPTKSVLDILLPTPSG
jgi:hypothetical protein